MREVHLELAGTVLGERGGRGDALGAADRVDAREHRGVLIEVGHRVDLGAELATPGPRQRRRLGLSCGGACAVDEVELVLDRDHWGEVEPVEPIEHLDEHVTRITEERSPVGLVHRDLQLRHAVGLPRDGHQRVRQRATRSVGVAFIETEAAGLNGTAQHIEGEHGARQHHPRTIDPLDAPAIDPLAAFDRVQIVQEDIEESGIRMPLEKGGQFRKIFAAHAGPAGTGGARRSVRIR